MEIANIILKTYSDALTAMVGNFCGSVSTLNDNITENLAIIKTLNIQIESIRSQIAIIQGVIDKYPEN